jgi:hypothetical protein
VSLLFPTWSGDRLRVIERLDRRVLGAFDLVDSATRLPITAPMKVMAQSATVIQVHADGTFTSVKDVPLGSDAVKLGQNRVGRWVVLRAPHLDAYAATFENPGLPPELIDPLHALQLRLNLAVTNAGPNHLPRLFHLDVPADPDPGAARNIFQVPQIELLRSPLAGAQAGWATLRVSVVQATTGMPLPGVLIRVFRRPRAPNSPPLGTGMTEWRRAFPRGEALVSIPGLERFVPGAAGSFVSAHPIELEVTRNTTFDGSGDTLPDLPALLAGAGANVVRLPPDQPPAILRVLRPAGPLALSAGSEIGLALEMP